MLVKPTSAAGGGVVSSLPTFCWNTANGVPSCDPDRLGLTPTLIMSTRQPGASLMRGDLRPA